MTRTRLLVEKNKRRKEIREKVRAAIISVLMLLIGIWGFGHGITTAAGNDANTWIKPQYVSYCEEIGQEFNISAELLISLIENESGGNPNEVSSVDAVGLCQIIPKYSKYTREQLFDPYTNIYAAAELLTEYGDKYGEIGNALVAYNCGEYSKTFKRTLNTGELTKYAKKVLNRAYELETVRGKHDY